MCVGEGPISHTLGKPATQKNTPLKEQVEPTHSTELARPQIWAFVLLFCSIYNDEGRSRQSKMAKSLKLPKKLPQDTPSFSCSWFIVRSHEAPLYKGSAKNPASTDNTSYRPKRFVLVAPTRQLACVVNGGEECAFAGVETFALIEL